mmetsp:Transcript_23658/g.65675  ORF Transcript_23658/g.65675 Transcript_23658/m.65675 type:complete len:110 (+) Transcript_23658:213-542(+)
MRFCTKSKLTHCIDTHSIERCILVYCFLKNAVLSLEKLSPSINGTEQSALETCARLTELLLTSILLNETERPLQAIQCKLQLETKHTSLFFDHEINSVKNNADAPIALS